MCALVEPDQRNLVKVPAAANDAGLRNEGLARGIQQPRSVVGQVNVCGASEHISQAVHVANFRLPHDSPQFRGVRRRQVQTRSIHAARAPGKDDPAAARAPNRSALQPAIGASIDIAETPICVTRTYPLFPDVRSINGRDPGATETKSLHHPWRSPGDARWLTPLQSTATTAPG